MIVAEEAMVRAGITGAKFTDVTEPGASNGPCPLPSPSSYSSCTQDGRTRVDLHGRTTRPAPEENRPTLNPSGHLADRGGGASRPVEGCESSPWRVRFPCPTANTSEGLRPTCPVGTVPCCVQARPLDCVTAALQSSVVVRMQDSLFDSPFDMRTS
ncbi:hypothetical protein D7Y21_40280 [Corallococcus sp. AB045]|nr:hypothetical protein D7Y21_40280 [Corallococcus sp. AB045]